MLHHCGASAVDISEYNLLECLYRVTENSLKYTDGLNEAAEGVDW